MWHGLRRSLLCVFLYNLLTKTTLVPFLMRIYVFFVRHYACTAETAISSEGWQLWTLRWLQTPVFFSSYVKKIIIFFLHTTAYPVKWPYCAAKKTYNLLIHEMQEPLVKHFSQRPQFFIRQWVHWVSVIKSTRIQSYSPPCIKVKTNHMTFHGALKKEKREKQCFGKSLFTNRKAGWIL